MTRQEARTNMKTRTELRIAAQQIVHQWDHHDKYRNPEGENNEPTEVAIARDYLLTIDRLRARREPEQEKLAMIDWGFYCSDDSRPD